MGNTSGIKVVVSAELSKQYDKRYVVVEEETGIVVDDAQGYGYRTPQKAHAAWAYKTRDRSKNQEKQAREKMIRSWMKQNKAFIKALDECAFEIAKGSWGAEDKVDTKFVTNMLKEFDLHPEFTAFELLKVWRKS